MSLLFWRIRNIAKFFSVV